MSNNSQLFFSNHCDHNYLADCVGPELVNCTVPEPPFGLRYIFLVLGFSFLMIKSVYEMYKDTMVPDVNYLGHT